MADGGADGADPPTPSEASAPPLREPPVAEPVGSSAGLSAALPVASSVALPVPPSDASSDTPSVASGEGAAVSSAAGSPPGSTPGSAPSTARPEITAQLGHAWGPLASSTFSATAICCDRLARSARGAYAVPP